MGEKRKMSYEIWAKPPETKKQGEDIRKNPLYTSANKDKKLFNTNHMEGEGMGEAD